MAEIKDDSGTSGKTEELLGIAIYLGSLHKRIIEMEALELLEKEINDKCDQIAEELGEKTDEIENVDCDKLDFWNLLYDMSTYISEKGNKSDEEISTGLQAKIGKKLSEFLPKIKSCMQDASLSGIKQIVK